MVAVTDRALMQLVAGKSPAAQRGALSALRAIEVDSPMVAHRIARVAETALLDPEADWAPDDRERLAEACARGVGGTSRDDPARARLSTLLTDSGLPAAELARVLGRDPRTVRRWMSGEMPIPEAVGEMLARSTLAVNTAAVTVTYRRWLTASEPGE